MDIMSLLGHTTTLQMTSRYIHAVPENLRTAVDSLNNDRRPQSAAQLHHRRFVRGQWSPKARQDRANWLLEPIKCDRLIE
jgi:hypothetical protein